ncbi:hypothetical protein [Luteibacter aegosomatissinici]|uniref:hypothetical protein n=1 Tax=Luteibacter aegosomatissinici TaxID=2911539 RepID=UPI001FF7C811|nr:hypothetical protein [Luteibacter aegosomatissinici]UPG93871.1 hypothetical protein L2Y97_18855 [Luteibacter aegosomatissinici]
MNKRKIARLMCQRIEGLKQSGGYFFHGEFEHVLRGVLLEYVPRGMHLWHFRFPLLDFFGENLLYSNRFSSGGFIARDELLEEAIVDRVLAHPELTDALRPGPPTSLQAFLQFLDGSEAMLNPHAHLVYASGLVLDWQGARAIDVMEQILPQLSKRDVEHCHRLQAELRQGADTAIALLDEVRQKNLRAFGLT